MSGLPEEIGSRIGDIKSEEEKGAVKKVFRQPGNLVFLEHDITTRFPYEDNSFDLVNATWVLHRLNEQGQEFAVKESLRVLKSGGFLHLHNFTDSEARELLEKAAKILKREENISVSYTINSSGVTLRWLVKINKLSQEELMK